MPYAQITPILIILRTMEFFAHIFLLNSIITKKISKKQYALSTAIIVILYEILTLVIPGEYKFIMVFILITATVTLVCKINLYEVAIGYLITSLIILLLDIVSGIILFVSLDAKKFQEVILLENNNYYYCIAILTLNTLILMIGIAVKYIKITFTNAEISKKDVGIAFNLLLMLFFVLPTLSLIISYFEQRPLSIGNIVICIVSMSAMLVVSIFNSQKRYNLLISEKNLEEEKNHNMILESLVDGLRAFKHDYNNTLSTLYGYVQLNKTEALEKMFKEILEESRQISTLDKLNPNIIKDPNVFGILIAKYQECIKKNITMNVEIYTELEDIDIKIYDLTRMLGIFLDNAIEAALESKEKKINLLITEEKGKKIIKISNTYEEKEILIEKIYEKGMSSKGANRGLGLYKVKEILKKCSGVELKTTSNKEEFVQKLIIEKI